MFGGENQKVSQKIALQKVGLKFSLNKHDIYQGKNSEEFLNLENVL